jgi:hypothetical protein
MATSRDPGAPGRLNPRALRALSPASRNASADEPEPTDSPNSNTPGHPEARGTLPMARKLTDPAIEEEIQALAAEAPLPTVDQAARLARLLRLNRHHRADAA